MSRKRIRATLLFSILVAGSSSCNKHAPDTAEYRFDAAGRLQTLITPDGNRINCSWDSNGLLEELRYRGGRVRYGYDPARQLAWLKDDGGLTALNRDALGRVRDVIWTRAEIHRFIHYDYDLWHHVTDIEVYNLDAATSSGRAPAAKQQLSHELAASEGKWRQWRTSVLETSAWLRKHNEFSEYRVAYRYDPLGRMISLDGPGGVVLFTYRDGGREVERRLPNGIATVQRSDDGKRLTRVTHIRADGSTLADYQYKRDTAGHLESVVETESDATRTTRLQWTGDQLSGFDMPDGESMRIDRDASGSMTSARVGGNSVPYAYDRFGRLIRAGNASWVWDSNGWLDSFAADGRAMKVRYDGRGLPRSASVDDRRATYDFDALGHMASLKVNNQERYRLADPIIGTDLPLLDLDSSGRLVSAKVYGSELITETNSQGEPSYILRDGLNKPRLISDRHGTIRMSQTASSAFSRVGAARNPPSDPSTSLMSHLLSAWWTPQIVYAADGDHPNPWSLENVDAATDFAKYIEEQNYFQKLGLLSSATQGWNNEQKIQSQFQNFLDSSSRGTVDLYLNGINNDWADAAASTRSRCADGGCLFLPTFGSIPKLLDIPATVFEKIVQDVPFGDILQTRKMDMADLIARADASGKTLHAIVCESGCGFELERNAEALVNYADTHPGVHLPELVIQSTDIGPKLTSELRTAGYVVKNESESGIVPWLVRPSSDFTGGLLGQTIFDAAFAVDQFVSHQPIVGSHGLNERWDLVQKVLNEDRTVASLRGAAPNELMNPFQGLRSAIPVGTSAQSLSVTNIRDTLPDLDAKLGGIELAARATPDAGIGPITGVVYDAQRGVAVLLGNRKLGVGGMQLSDLGWALKLTYSDTPTYPKFSLDPADSRNPRGDWLKAVYIPGSLAGTAMGHTMFLTDWLMKQYSFGLSADYNGRVERLATIPGGLRDMFTLSLSDSRTQKQEVWTRLWIVADDFRWSTTNDAVFFTAAKMAVRAKRQVVDPHSPTGLSDVETSLDPAAAQFARDFSDHYAEIAAGSPEFARLIDLAKAVALARWMREKSVPIDHKWLENQASRSGAATEKVHALTAYRDGEPSETRLVRGNVLETRRVTPRVYLFGGVDLSVAPRVNPDSGLSSDLTDATRRALTNASRGKSFDVIVRGETLAGEILPVTEAGQRVDGKPRVVEVNGTRREYSATGRLERLIGKDGSIAAFQYAGDRISSATENITGATPVRYSFDASGSITRIEQDSGNAEIQRTPSGRIVKATFTGEHGWRAIGVRKSDGTEWSIELPGYEPVRYEFSQGGYLDKVIVGDETLASLHIDSPSQTITVRDFATDEERLWKQDEVPYDAALAEPSPATLSPARKRVQRVRGSASAEAGDVFKVVAEPVGQLPDAPDELRRKRIEEARTMSTPGTAILFADSFRREPDGRIRLQLGGRELTPLQSVMDEFLNGGEAPAELDALLRADRRPARLLVVAPSSATGEPGREQLDALHLTRALNREYGIDTQSYLATDAKLGLQNLANLPSVGGAKDVVALAPGEGWRVKDYEKLKPIHDQLRAAGVDVVEGVHAFEQGNVLILSGHKDNELRAYARALGERGSLKGRYVLLFTCNAVSDIDLNAGLIREYGARGIYFFGDTLNIYAVRDVLLSLADRLQNGPRGNQSLTMLIRQAVQRAIGETRSEGLRKELNKLLYGVTQVSELGRSPGGWNG